MTIITSLMKSIILRENMMPPNIFHLKICQIISPSVIFATFFLRKIILFLIRMIEYRGIALRKLGFMKNILN